MPFKLALAFFKIGTEIFTQAWLSAVVAKLLSYVKHILSAITTVFSSPQTHRSFMSFHVQMFSKKPEIEKWM